MIVQPPSGGAAPTDLSPLREVAHELEVTFLAEMLRHAGMDADGGGTGIGGEQMASFRARVHADALVASGGIGLAEAFVEALADRAPTE